MTEAQGYTGERGAYLPVLQGGGRLFMEGQSAEAMFRQGS